MGHRIPGICGWMLLAAGALWGQAPADPPSRVARLSFLDGPVAWRPAGVEEWAAASLNVPLTTGDRLWTDEEAHAEIHIGATAVHLAPRTGFAILLLDDRVAQMSLTEGAANVRVPRLGDEEIIEIDTPAGAVTLLRPGDYRIDVSPEGNYTLVTVRSGEAEVAVGGRVLAVHAGQTLRLFADDQLTSEFLSPAPLDPWDEWCLGRDQLAERALGVAEQYVPLEMAGAEDLGQYGEWEVDGDDGPVWRPGGLPADWAPYRYGHWIYKTPWGWTWVDNAPWGFTPFHYGRWRRWGSYWVWLPGPRGIRPIYAPALVGWLGDWGGGYIAWFPLGPGEFWRPPYRTGDGYLRNVNAGIPAAPAGRRSNYANRGDATAVAPGTFSGARSIAPARARAGRGPGATQTADAPAVQPGRESYLGSGRPPARTPRPSQPAADRPVIVRRQLPPDVRPAIPVASADRRPQRPRPTAPDSGPPPTEAQGIRGGRRTAPVAAPDRGEGQARRQDGQLRQQAQQQEDQRRAEEQRSGGDQRRQEEQQRADEQRRADDQRRVDEQRRAEEGRRADEQRRQQAEHDRQAMVERQAEQRRAEEGRRQDEQRRAEEGRRQDEQRRAEEGRRQDEQHRAEEGRRQDEQRRAEEGRRQDEQRRAEEGRRQDEQRRAEEGRRQDEQRRAEEQKRQDDARKKQ